MPNGVYEIWNKKVKEARKKLNEATSRGASQKKIEEIENEIKVLEKLRDESKDIVKQRNTEARRNTNVNTLKANNVTVNTVSQPNPNSSQKQDWKDSIKYDVTQCPQKQTKPSTVSTNVSKPKLPKVSKPRNVKPSPKEKRDIKKAKTIDKKKVLKFVAGGMLVTMLIGVPVVTAIHKNFKSEPTSVITEKKARENMKEYNKIADKKITWRDQTRYIAYMEYTRMKEDLTFEEFKEMTIIVNEKYWIEIPENLKEDYDRYINYVTYLKNNTEWTMDIAGLDLIDGSVKNNEEEAVK